MPLPREDVEATTRADVELLSAHLNTYGRKINLIYVDGSGPATDDAAGKGALRPLSFARLARLDLVHCDEGKRARARSVVRAGRDLRSRRPPRRAQRAR